MTDSSLFYEKNLYPFQNGVLNIVTKLNLPFYLTGGTALSRGYYNHRYSDDLDFFVNADADFFEYSNAVIKQLQLSGYQIDKDNLIKNENFFSIIALKDNNSTSLKIDFVNDIDYRVGTIVKTPLFYRTDNLDNILSNKLSAIFRYSAKDIADIREICLHHRFNWKTATTQAQEKENALDIFSVAEILQGIPQKEFESIKWIQKPDWQQFKKDLEEISNDISLGKNNTLCVPLQRQNKKEYTGFDR